jgi:hypothetical protein
MSGGSRNTEATFKQYCLVYLGMKLLQISSKIVRWQQSNDAYIGHLNDGEKQSFLLMPHHPVNKSLFKVSANIYITNIETDFILDINIDSIIQFNIDGPIPMAKDLYEAYCAAHADWRDIILKESISKGILIDRKSPPISFNELEGYLKLSIQKTYPQN